MKKPEYGKDVSYRYDLRTKERMYTVSATNMDKIEPRFTAATAEVTVVEKEVVINGTTAALIGIQDFNGYHLYIENNG